MRVKMAKSEKLKLSLLILFEILLVGQIKAAESFTLSNDLEDFQPVEPGHQHLGIDKAYLYIDSDVTSLVYLYAQVDVCEKCTLVAASSTPIKKDENSLFAMDTRWGVTLALTSSFSEENNTVLCSIHEYPQEHGNYTMYISANKTETESQSSTQYMCTFAKHGIPADSNIPIYVALAVFAGLAIVCLIMNFMYRNNVFKKLYDKLKGEDDLVNSDLGSPSTNVQGHREDGTVEPIPDAPKKKRVRSVDAFRGFCLVIMIFVDYKGGYYWFFRHSKWNGLTLADLVFPWFTFIIGTSVALSFHNLLKKGISRRVLVCKVTKRTFILFAIGLILNTGGEKTDLNYLRIPGVLQRLAISYFAVAVMQVFFAQIDDPHQYKKWAPVRDILPYWPEWILNTVLVAVHLCLTFLLPLDHGCPKGYLGPGGLHDNSEYINCTGGAAGTIDRWVFGENHIYQHPTCKEVYHTTVPHDPEGILGTLTSVFMCFLGLQAGKILLIYRDWKSRTCRWLLWSILLGGIAGGLCKFSQNDGVIPVNKNLWSVSFVLCLAAMAFFILTIFYLVIDVYDIWSGTPFFYPGMNSILVYICHEVFESFFPVSWKVPETHAAQLAMNLWGPTCWIIVSMVLYYKGIFITI